MPLDNLEVQSLDGLLAAFFLKSPWRFYSAYEISRVCKLELHKTSRQLSKIADSQILDSFVKKGQKYYALNLKYHFSPNVKNALLKKYRTKNSKNLLLNKLSFLGNVRTVILSGLFTGQSNLPVDILIVGKIRQNRLEQFLQKIQTYMSQEINYSLMSQEEYLSRKGTFDRFIRDIFDHKHVIIFDKLEKKRRSPVKI